MADKLLIAAGDVIEVQLTSETVVIEGARGLREAEPGHITNRMRLFVRETDGKEQKYDFEDTELGVRETQRVAIVRGQAKKAPAPFNMVLYNLSSGERDTFENGLHTYLSHRPFFGPLWKAGAFSFGVAVVFWFVSNYITRNGTGGSMSIWLALMFGFLTYPVFWWLCRVWDRITERMRYKGARKRFLKDMDGRVRAYAPSTAPAPQAAAPLTEAVAPTPAPQPDPPPEPSTA